MGISVSVVIPTYKRPHLLKRCIDAVLMQTFEKSAYEIIVVDDAPSEETRRLVQAYALGTSAPLVRYMTAAGKKGPAAARNRGWSAAEGSIIAFTDDDCIPEPDWLEKGTSAFRGTVVGISGRVIVPVGDEPTDYELNASFLENSEFVTANCFYLKKILEKVGGFDERFTAAWREDADLFFTLLKRQERLVTVPEAVVLHPVRAGHWGISIKEQKKSMFNALLYKKHPDLYRKKIHNPLLLHYYSILISSLIFFLSIILGNRHLGLISLSAWMTLTVFISLKRLRGTSHSPKHVLEMFVTSLIIPFLSIYWRTTGAVRFHVFFY